MKKVYTFLILLFCVQAAFAQKTLKYNNDGKFKIVQFTDIHYKSDHEAAKSSIEMIKEVLATEKPDFIALTGDIVTMKPAFQGWDEVLAPIIESKIPWAVVFGNHDDEYDKTRAEIMEYVTKKANCLAERGPENIKGVGNYVIEVVDGNGKKHLLYFMDSNTYSTIEGIGGYGWFGFDQIEWYRNKSKAYTAANNGKPLPALAFFHIPLNEYTDMSLARKKMVGMRNEKECPGAINSGMYTAMKECGDVVGTFVGHDHDNDYIGNYNGIYLAYGRFSGSKTTYTHMMNGARIIEITAGEPDFKTWIRLKGDQTINTVNTAEFLPKNK